MLITDVRAHHIRIPYDAGVASFKQGASAIAALDIVLVEVSTDAGLTGWGDAWGYVCPRSTAAAVERNDCASGAWAVGVPDASDIPSFMERIQRNLHLFGRYGITMFAISGLDIALWDLAARAEGRSLHQLLGAGQVREHSSLCKSAPDRRSSFGGQRVRGRAAAWLSRREAA